MSAHYFNYPHECQTGGENKKVKGKQEVAANTRYNELRSYERIYISNFQQNNEAQVADQQKEEEEGGCL